MAKKINTFSLDLQKIFTISGLVLITLTIVATIFAVVQANIYIYDTLDYFLDSTYFGRYVVTLIGGFGIGLLFAWLSCRKQKKGKSIVSPLFTGISFGLLTVLVFFLLDMLRLPYRDIFGTLPFPWEKIVFMGMSLFALLVTTIVTGIVFLKKGTISASNKWFQRIFIGAFVLQQITIFTSVSFISSDAEQSLMSLFIGILYILITPTIIAATTYFSLSGLKDKTQRLFSASMVGTLYSVATLVLWEFRTNPENQATIIFSYIVTAITLASAAALIIFLRRAIVR